MKLSLERSLVAGFALLLALLGAIGVVAYLSTAELVAEGENMRRAEEVLTRLESLLSAATDAESGARGYAITGDEGFLEPYLDARARALEEVAALRVLGHGDAAPLHKLADIEALLGQRLDRIDVTVALRRSAGFEAARQPFDLSASIAKVAAIVRPLAESKGLALRVELADGLGRALGDARRAEQVLLNLLGNAIKFTERGAVTLRAAAADGGTIRIDVADTGIGIAPEDTPTLFQPFRQIDNRLSRNHEGTGLGLAIARELARLMNGDVTVASRPHQGSVFSLSLPATGP